VTDAARSISLSRPSRAPRAASSRAESISEPRREIRGEDTPRDAREPNLAQPAGVSVILGAPLLVFRSDIKGAG
jgi:hypothetical protein